ncbi:RAB11-binding protein RELCH homolog isoform X1 [Lampetra fluviatilis]
MSTPVNPFVSDSEEEEEDQQQVLRRDSNRDDDDDRGQDLTPSSRTLSPSSSSAAAAAETRASQRGEEMESMEEQSGQGNVQGSESQQGQGNEWESGYGQESGMEQEPGKGTGLERGHDQGNERDRGQGHASRPLPLDVVAAQLLRDQLLLTALELHSELLERDQELPRLRDFFSNPGNFERLGLQSQQQQQQVQQQQQQQQHHLQLSVQPTHLHRAGSLTTLDSLDFARYSDDGNRDVDERVAGARQGRSCPHEWQEHVKVLEFELRKARETIQALRTDLTQAAETNTPTQEKNNEEQMPACEDPMRPLEKRALNFLVNEFLLKNEFKLTSITFSDENGEQDIEVWDDVGLNIPKPPDLLTLYRDYGSRIVPPSDTLDVGVGPDHVENPDPDPEDDPSSLTLGDLPDGSLSNNQAEVVKELNQLVERLRHENESLTAQIRQLESEIAALQFPAGMSVTVPENRQEEAATPRSPGDEGELYITIRDVAPTQKTATVQDATLQGETTRSDVASSPPSSSSPPDNLTLRDVDDHVISEQDLDDQVQLEKSKRKLPETFMRTLMQCCMTTSNSRLGCEVAKIADSEKSVISVLGRCLPHIVPNVLLAKREELIPVLLCTACLHPESKQRDELLNILFNLIKRPDEQQRKTILVGCVAFARHVGPARAESELLPQCWEQISHKYPERRELVAEACGVLAPYLPMAIRSSLVLSMLQQMLHEDKTETVREASVRSLGVVISYIDDPDKYFQAFDLLLMALRDTSERVLAATHQTFLPAFGMWACELARVQTHLANSLLSKVETAVLEENSILDESKLHQYILALQSLVPFLFLFVLQTSPFAEEAEACTNAPKIEVGRFPSTACRLAEVTVAAGGPERLSSLLVLYERRLDGLADDPDTQAWESMRWIQHNMLPRLVEVACKIPVTSPSAVHDLATFVSTLCRTFGRQFTSGKVKPLFQKHLVALQNNPDAATVTANSLLAKATVPVYALGILTCYTEESDRKLLSSFMEDVMMKLSVNQLPLDSLKVTFVELGANPAYHEMLLAVLWCGVVHTSPQVRCTAAKMFELALRGMHEALIDKRVAPALVTLSSDPEFSVRIATIPALGAIIETVTQKELLERVKMQLASFLDDGPGEEQHALQLEIIRTLGRVGPNAEPRFRDEFMLPSLHVLSMGNNQQATDGKRMEVAVQLFEAYSALACCFIGEDVMVQHFLPGLRALRTDMEHLSHEHEVILSSMIKDFEFKLDGKATADPSLPSPVLMEDAKNKFFSKVGQLTTSSSTAFTSMLKRKK